MKDIIIMRMREISPIALFYLPPIVGYAMCHGQYWSFDSEMARFGLLQCILSLSLIIISAKSGMDIRPWKILNSHPEITSWDFKAYLVTKFIICGQCMNLSMTALSSSMFYQIDTTSTWIEKTPHVYVGTSVIWSLFGIQTICMQKFYENAIVSKQIAPAKLRSAATQTVEETANTLPIQVIGTTSYEKR